MGDMGYEYKPRGAKRRMDRYTRKATPDKYFRLIRYAKDKLEERDWHGLADAAMDLREMEAANPKLAEMERPR